MKTKRIVLVSFVVVVIWMLQPLKEGYSYQNGAPSAVSGSPGDNNKTCAKSGCHTGNAVVNVPGIITSNVPPSGYIPGTTYTITATCAQTGIVRWGFEISPQSVTGALLGQLVITNTTETKIVSTKYVTQKSAGSGGTGSHTWSFNWVAPVAGTGDVTFYGTFNYANDNGGTSGDFIKTSTLLLNENTGAGIAGYIAGNDVIELFPNPVADYLTLRYTLTASSRVQVSVSDLGGKLIKQLNDEMMQPGILTEKYNVKGLQPGIYIVSFITSEKIISRKFTVL